MNITLPWREQLIIDTYASLPNGAGSDLQATERYAFLANQHGHLVPKNVGPSIRNGRQRLSSSSKIYHQDGWDAKGYPDVLEMQSRGHWRIRPAVLRCMQNTAQQFRQRYSRLDHVIPTDAQRIFWGKAAKGKSFASSAALAAAATSSYPPWSRPDGKAKLKH